ncbi:LPS export ABC transporter periplasmic protein LptC [Odoribacter sp. OttesenSCG-928-J03]|nr:LPS export ABC transporter periplasmic protein LptC [Odoribacter sp. OttesenSCG-928-J03]MDL2330684.1 LPS export ABC transporter periplasmic protein LptC [Odoribacter sp. OttesenSCG-928-A06]
MILTFIKNFITRSIIILFWIIMLFACKNDIEKIKELGEKAENLPEMSGENLEMIYSDSARIKYKVITPQYYKITINDEKYDEFPKGIHVISYDDEEKIAGSIQADYAQKKETANIWEARHNVIVINSDGTKLETELLFWDVENKRIYSPKYSRLTMSNNIVEGNNGFESDQDLKNPVFNSITGKIEYNTEQN